MASLFPVSLARPLKNGGEPAQENTQRRGTEPAAPRRTDDPTGCPTEETARATLTASSFPAPTTGQAPGTLDRYSLCSGRHTWDEQVQFPAPRTGLAREWTPATGGDEAEAEHSLPGLSIKRIPALGGGSDAGEFESPLTLNI